MKHSADTPLDSRQELSRALSLGAMLLCAVYIVARPLANQFTPYSSEAAFAGLALCLLGGICGILLVLQRGAVLPRSLLLCALIWLGLLVWGAARSPNMGRGIPYAVDFSGYILLLLCGYILAQWNRENFSLVVRLLIAMTAVEAFSGLWQHYVELPRLLSQPELLPDVFKSTAGNARLHSGNVFGSFGYPNALSIYLVMGFLMLTGTAWATLRSPKSQTFRQNSVALILFFALGLLLLSALYFTDSKGAFVALASGFWALFVFRKKYTHPRLYRGLCLVSLLSLCALISALVLATLGVISTRPFGLSLQVRFEYWRATIGMIQLDPVQGLGLAGFAEHYAFFKTTLGTEVKEVHNDYLQLWVELGPLGLLTYLGTWWMVLRSRYTEVRSECVSESSSTGSRLEWTALIGALLAFIFMGFAFQTLNAGDLKQLFEGSKESGVLVGAFFALAAPALFVCVFIATRRFKNIESLTFATKAALAAVLLHELVDFNIRAQAVLGSCFLLGGMLLALRLNSTEQSRPQFSRFERMGRFLPLILSIGLLPLAVWIPALSGLARTNAESLEADTQALAAKSTTIEDQQTLRELRIQTAIERQEALRAAPYDAEAKMELAFALEALSEQGRKEAQLAHYSVVELFEQSATQRPFSHLPRALLGHHFCKNGEWKKALYWYQQASERYPLHPGLKIWLGDALLLDGQLAAAAHLYLEAFAIDQQINDTNVRLSAIYTDPRAGVFPHHRRDGEIFLQVHQLLLERNKQNGDAEILRGLTLRKLVGLCALIRESQRTKTGTDREQSGLRADIRATLEQFLTQQPDLGARAHAAFHAALSYQITDTDKSFSEEKKAAWIQAKQLHDEAQQAGTISTEQSLFNRLRIEFEK